VVFVADDLAAWLIGLLADAGRRRLTELVLGSEQERALRRAATAAVELTAEELHPEGGELAEELTTRLGQVFKLVLYAPMKGQGTLLETLQAGVAGQLAVLGDPGLTGTGKSSAEVMRVPVTVLADKLTSHLVREIVIRGARGGPLAPLANQLDHDVTHIYSQRVEGKIDRLADGILEALAGLERGLTVAERPTAAHTLPADVASFTGRHAELDQFMQALPGRASAGGMVCIGAIDGMPGVGKTAFAVHAAHQLAPYFPDGQLFVRLHGHTLRQRPVEPADALATLLLAAGIAPQHIPAGVEARAGLWRDRMAGRKALLLLDDATSSEQVRPLIPGTAGMLVLVTSRRRLAALPEALPVTLGVLEADEAADLFAKLVSRPGLEPTDQGVVAVVRLCEYLPLAISLMAGQLKHHRAWKTTDLAADLKSAGRLAVMTAENHSVAAAFSLSYGSLPADRQRLFRRLALQTGADIDVYAAAALDGSDVVTARRLLDDLFGYHLIVESTRGRYHFHDLIGEYARTLTSADQPAERDAAVDRLLDYYLHTARGADRHLPQRTPAGASAVTGTPPPDGPALPTREDAVTWMDAERLNLHAAADYAAHNDRPARAIAIVAAMNSFLRTQGHWYQALTLHHTALDMARRISDRLAEADALNNLGTVQRMTGDYPAATASQGQAVELYRQLGSRLGEANARNDLGLVQQATGDYPAATASQARALELYGDLGSRPGEANAVNDLGHVQRLTGDYPAAAASHARALELHRDLGNRLGQAYALNYLGVVQQATGDYSAATASHACALKLYRDLGNRLGQANALNDLGAVQRLTGDYPAATASHTRALKLYRDLDDRLGEAEALDELGVMQRLTGDYPAATASHTRALKLHRDLGNRLGEASALNNMGELSLVSATPAEAHARHKQAHAIATDIASPLEEARAQEGIGRCHLRDGQTVEGAASLRQALAIYEQIGSPSAGRVQTTLRGMGL